VAGLAKIHTIKLKGLWELGFALDEHTISSQFIGYDESGRERFQTERSVMEDLLYRLKCQSDIAVIPEMRTTANDYLERLRNSEWFSLRQLAQEIGMEYPEVLRG